MARTYGSRCWEISGSARHTPASAPAQSHSPSSPRGIPIHPALSIQLVLVVCSCSSSRTGIPAYLLVVLFPHNHVRDLFLKQDRQECLSHYGIVNSRNAAKSLSTSSAVL